MTDSLADRKLCMWEAFNLGAGLKLVQRETLEKYIV